MKLGYFRKKLIERWLIVLLYIIYFIIPVIGIPSYIDWLNYCTNFNGMLTSFTILTWGIIQFLISLGILGLKYLLVDNNGFMNAFNWITGKDIKEEFIEKL